MEGNSRLREMECSHYTTLIKMPCQIFWQGKIVFYRLFCCCVVEALSLFQTDDPSKSAGSVRDWIVFVEVHDHLL